jgi:signal transduction histidine kinase
VVRRFSAKELYASSILAQVSVQTVYKSPSDGMVDIEDLKSSAVIGVWVRVPPRAQISKNAIISHLYMDNPETLTNQQEKNLFFLVTAHELRTSLTAMKWSFDMLLENDFGPLNKEQNEIIKKVANSNERMVSLVNEVMSIMHNEDSSVSYKKDSINLKDLIIESTETFNSEILKNNMSVEYNLQENSIYIEGDKNKLSMVFHNLIENAIKYGKTGQSIKIKLEKLEKNAMFSISDQGISIPTEEQTQIFNKFFRATNAKKSQLGVGIGLYISKHIIEKHKGSIDFKSSIENGTTFTLSIPSI